jgi:hypothetical protein
MPAAVVDVIADDDTFFNPSGTLTLASAIGNGEALIVGILATNSISSITDNSAGTPALTLAYSNSLVHFYYRVNVSGSPSAVNITFGANEIPFVAAWRVTGLDNASPEDSGGDRAYADSGATFPYENHSVSISHTNSGSLIVGIANTAGFLDRSWTGGTGVTATREGADPNIFAALHRVAAGAGPTDIAWSVSAGRQCEVAFTAFSADAGGGGGGGNVLAWIRA